MLFQPWDRTLQQIQDYFNILITANPFWGASGQDVPSGKSMLKKCVKVWKIYVISPRIKF